MSHYLIIKLLRVLTTVVINKCPNKTTDVVGDIKRHHSETHNLQTILTLQLVHWSVCRQHDVSDDTVDFGNKITAADMKPIFFDWLYKCCIWTLLQNKKKENNPWQDHNRLKLSRSLIMSSPSSLFQLFSTVYYGVSAAAALELFSDQQ